MWKSCPRNLTRYLTAPSYALLTSGSEKTRSPFSRNTRSNPRVTTGIITFVWAFLSIRSILPWQNDSVSEGGVFTSLGTSCSQQHLKTAESDTITVGGDSKNPISFSTTGSLHPRTSSPTHL